MENAISIVRGEAEKHFSNGINCRLLHARLYHTSQKDCSALRWRRRRENHCSLLQAREGHEFS